ncbi:hypothetical protein KA977_07380, partial [Candidatus Dependentiae bacterium]|nr:hypothetical protein [Candidatus Dependentiae bacterium]
MRRIIYIIFIFLYFYFNVNAVCEDTLKLFENYFNNTGTDSPAYNFSVIFANMEKINTRSSLEKKIEEIVFILIEQEPELDLFYLGIPINYEENSLNKTLNLAYKNKNITINVKYELIKTYRFND